MAVTDADGIIYYRYIYDTYGELSDITTDDGVSLKSSEQLTEYRLSELAHATGIDYLYNGQYGVETDQNGLYYMRARYYDQDIKRFINRDVVSGDISNSQSLNRYCYVQGNPVSLTDPFGLCPDPNSNFKNFCKVLYYTDWNAVGHAALDMAGVFWEGADVLNAAWYLAEGNTEMAISSMLYAVPGFGIGIGNLMMKGAKFAPYGRIVSAVSRMTQSGMGIGAGFNMAQIGFTNMLHSAESGELNAEDVAMFIGGIAISTLSGKNLVPSTKSLMTISDGANKASKASKGYLTDSDVNSMPINKGSKNDLTIMSRNSSRGNPNAITHFDVSLNTRQSNLLNKLSGYDASVIVRKSDVNMNDLAALTAKTGDEFAMFTRGSQRLIIRGGPNNVNINGVRAQELYEAGYKWSGHTHPGRGCNVKMPSAGDKYILSIFKQNRSAIYDNKGQYEIFGDN